MACSTTRHLHITFPRLHVAHVQLRDALGKNSLVMLMLEELRVLLDNFSHDAEVYAIVLSETGDTTAGSRMNMIDNTTYDRSSQVSDQEAEMRRSASLRTWAASKRDCIAAVAGCQKRMSTSLKLCRNYDFWVKANNLAV